VVRRVPVRLCLPRRSFALRLHPVCPAVKPCP